MTDDDYSYLEPELENGPPGVLQGRLEGGPWDGIGFAFEDSGLGVFIHGLRFEMRLGTGRRMEDSEWHVYHVAGQSNAPETGPVLRAVHLGTLDGNPEDWPEGTRPGD